MKLLVLLLLAVLAELSGLAVRSSPQRYTVLTDRDHLERRPAAHPKGF